MPLPNDVLSLEELCVKSINAMLVSNKESILQKGYKWRLIFVENLPGNLRTDLLCYEFSKTYCGWNTGYALHQWVPASIVLFDSRIQRVPHICVYDLKTDLPLLVTFVSYLWIYRPKITELLMDLLYVDKNCLVKNSMHCIRFAMAIIGKYLDEGLMANLVHLQLTYQCNDSMLEAIGRHSACLKTLDVSCSTNVTVNGVKKLLFKDHAVLQHIKSQSTLDQLYEYLRSVNMDRDMLNAICFTLVEIRIQYTKANNMAWILVLSCIRNLKQIGWPEKCRNITKVIIAAWREVLKPKSLHLQLDTLSNWELSYDEIHAVAECLPHLKKLSISLTQSYGPSNDSSYVLLLKFWNNLQSLTLFMDDTTAEHFLIFCQHGYARNLSELTIKTFSTDIVFDLALLQSSCPNLTTLDIVSIALHINREPTGKFKNLRKVIMESSPIETKSWFLFSGCPVLEEFKIFNEVDYEFWKNIFHKPSPLIRQQIKSLEIMFILPDGYSEYLRPPIFINHMTITEFIVKCSVLNIFGSILNIGMTLQDIENIHNFIREHNYSLTIY